MSPIAPGGCGVPHTGRQIGVGIGCTGMGSGRGGGWIGGGGRALGSGMGQAPEGLAMPGSRA